ncbi:DEKNAAC101205 [Brettanomyces naardenensis]|uniref:Large ribosomal subunit protein mL38 n=1 Tax=Brettanomyces naardenensis TaxID=13370 RepID=A0A448YHK5_BRENA|nr:DEKNAAC101205 [Brettanomyces naardenensis]
MSSVSKGIWSNFARRSQSLALRNRNLQKALLSPTLPHGPVSLKKRSSKDKYQSPIGMDEIYPLAYQYLESQSEKTYKKIEEIEKQLEEVADSTTKSQLKDRKTQLEVDAEVNNPEIIYNSLFGTNSIDRTQPVYRHYLEKQWKDYGRMLIMQRLETLAVIPDTLATLDPQVDVRLKFPGNNIERWIEPGDILSSNATCRPPSLEVIEFKESKNDLYTVLIVDPDTPDVENDSFSTTLHWGLKNVALSNEDGVIDAKKLVGNPEYEFVSYLPPTPEKNTGNHRIAVWVFRQAEGKKVDEGAVERGSFDIRKFAEENELTAVGAHLWRSVWDRNTENVRKMYGLGRGRIFSRDRN